MRNPRTQDSVSAGAACRGWTEAPGRGSVGRRTARAMRRPGRAPDPAGRREATSPATASPGLRACCSRHRPQASHCPCIPLNPYKLALMGHRVAGRPGREPIAGGRDDAVAHREGSLSAPLIRPQGMRSRRRLATGNPLARFGAEHGVGLRRGTARHGLIGGCRNRFRPACAAGMPETSSRADRVQRTVIDTSRKFRTVSDPPGAMTRDGCSGADPRPLSVFAPPPVARFAV